eukprot:scaffold8832_cov139-Amphora_coffeaeformis.AAC.1
MVEVVSSFSGGGGVPLDMPLIYTYLIVGYYDGNCLSRGRDASGCLVNIIFQKKTSLCILLRDGTANGKTRTTVSYDNDY